MRIFNINRKHMIMNNCFLLLLLILSSTQMRGMEPETLRVQAKVTFEVFNNTNEDIDLEYLEVLKNRSPFWAHRTIKSGESKRSPKGELSINIISLPRKEQYITAKAEVILLKTTRSNREISLVNIAAALKFTKYSPPSYEKQIDIALFHSGTLCDEYLIRVKAKGENLEQSTIETFEIMQNKNNNSE